MKKSLFILSLAAVVAITTACGTDEPSDANLQEESEEEVATDETDMEVTEDEEPEPVEEANEEEVTDNEWETQVGDTTENEAGSFTLHARNDTTDPIETGSISLTLNQVNTVSGELTEEFASYLDDKEDINYIQLDMEVANSSEETINFYAGQATVTTSTGEQLDMPNGLMSDHIGGEFIGAVSKSGSLIYLLENSLAEDVEWVRILINAPQNDNYEKIGEDIDIKVEL